MKLKMNLYSKIFNEIERFIEENPRFENLIMSLFSSLHGRLYELREAIINWLLYQRTDIYLG